MGWIGDNIFEAPGLPKDMLEQEKLFITIEVWSGDGYIVSASKLDFGTKRLLRKKPEGEGKYFSWSYSSPEESSKYADKEIAERGYTTSSGDGYLSVSRKNGWKRIEDELHDKWYDEGLWE